MESIIYEVFRNKKGKRLFPKITEREEKKFQRLADEQLRFILNTDCPNSTKELLKFILQLREFGYKYGEKVPEVEVVSLDVTRGEFPKVKKEKKIKRLRPAVNYTQYA